MTNQCSPQEKPVGECVVCRTMCLNGKRLMTSDGKHVQCGCWCHFVTPLVPVEELALVLGNPEDLYVTYKDAQRLARTLESKLNEVIARLNLLANK